jgi:transposase
LELRPIAGRTWAPRAHPDRLPATYTRPHGARQWLAFLDKKKDRLWGYSSRRKRWTDVLRAFKWMRTRYPLKERIYTILDNFSPHKRPEVLRWARDNNVILVWTPTNASWINHIECQFTELKRFVFTNSDYKSHKEVTKAISDFLRYRNRRNAKHKKTNLKQH